METIANKFIQHVVDNGWNLNPDQKKGLINSFIETVEKHWISIEEQKPENITKPMPQSNGRMFEQNSYEK